MRALLAALAVVGLAGGAMAEDARPAGHPASEKSIKGSAPAADTTTTTGSHQQGSMIRKMNADEKRKVEKEGK